MTGPLRVELFGNSAEEWDAFVRRQSGWTHAHQTVYLAARDDAGELAGVLPLVRVRSPIFGHFIVSMPFVNYGGPLGSDGAVAALIESATALVDAHPTAMLELRSRYPLPTPLPVSHRKVTVVLDLPSGTPDVLWKQLPSKLRSQIRRPQKEGVTVRFGPDQVAPFFRVFAHHMRDLGTPTQPQRLFRTIAEVFPDDAIFGCAYLGEEPIACGCGFRWGTEFEMTWASSLVAHKAIAPNMLLYWAFMERAVQEKLGTFNFGRCTPGSGTHRFKLQWGARDETLWWYHRSADAKTKTPSPDDGAYAWGPLVWRRLPVPVATALGPRIVRYIP